MAATVSVSVAPGGPHQVTRATAGWSANGLPLSGQLLFGAATDGWADDINDVDDLAYLEETMIGGGAKFGVHRTYYKSTATNFQDPDNAAADATKAHTAGVIPWQSVKFTGPNYPTTTGGPGTWAGVAAGDEDTWINAYIDSLGALDGPVWVCFHHEPDTGDDEGTPAEFRAAMQHIHPLVAAYDNLAFTVIMGGYQQTHNGTWDWDDFYPGDAYCDVYAYDPYMFYQADVQPGSFWELDDGTDGGTYSASLDSLDDWATTGGHDVLLGIGEFGIVNTASATAQNYDDPTYGVILTTGPGSEWIERGFDGAKARGGRWACLAYWPVQGTNNWTVDGTESGATNANIAKADLKACCDKADLYPFT